MKSLLPLSLVALVVATVAPNANAATLIYGSPVSVPDDSGSVFLNSGTQVFGMNVGNGGPSVTTINSVVFNAGGYNSATLTQTQSQTIALTVVTDANGGRDTPVAPGLYSSGSVNDLLNSNFFTDAGAAGSITLSFSGLNIGQEYRVQSFHLMDTGNEGSREMFYDAAGANDSAAFEQTYTSGSLSNAVAMTFSFTADAVTQNVSLLPVDPGAGIDRSYLNGIAVYAVPEPSTTALMVLGGVGAIAFLRRRHRQA